MTAVELAETDTERWLLGDGLIDEQVATRPVLRERWRAQYRSNPAVRAVYAAMWEDFASLDHGWWAEPEA